MTSGSQRDKNPEQNQTTKGVEGSSSLLCPGLEQVHLGMPLPAGPRGFRSGCTHVHTRTRVTVRITCDPSSPQLPPSLGWGPFRRPARLQGSDHSKQGHLSYRVKK